MSGEFNLSERIQKGVNIREQENGGVIYTKDVKEFIRRLKDKFSRWCDGRDGDIQAFEMIIDKLAGEKLTK